MKVWKVTFFKGFLEISHKLCKKYYLINIFYILDNKTQDNSLKIPPLGACHCFVIITYGEFLVALKLIKKYLKNKKMLKF